jgi:tetratricopeptide (TPR) repeat protein
VADLLGRLVDKSLVVADDAGAGYRYRLLEPVRQYALERLTEAGEREQLDARHYDFYLALARAADPECWPSGAETHPERLEADHDNLRAALAWALRSDPQKAMRLAVTMWPMWMARSQFLEGRRLLSAALEAAPEPTTVRAEALRASSGLDIRLGRTADLGREASERIGILRELGDRRGEAFALDGAGVCEYMVGRNDSAARLLTQSLELSEELGDRKAAAGALHSLAVLAQCRADFTGAREALLAALSRLRQVPADDREPFFRVQTMGLFLAAGIPGGPPRMYFEESVQLFRRVDATTAIGYVLSGLGDVARAESLMEPARERLNESLAHFRELRNAMGVAFALGRLGNLAGMLREFELGREWLEEALTLRRELGDRRAVGMTLSTLGVLAGAGGDFERGEALLRDALALFEETDDAPGQMGMHLNLGNLAAYVGQTERARGLLVKSREMAEQQLLKRCAGWIDLRLAELDIEENEPERAAELIDSALVCLRPLGDRWGVEWALELDQMAAKRPLSPAREG